MSSSLGRVYLRGNTWWIRYSFRGRRIRESSHSENRVDAARLLRKRLSEIERGLLPGNKAEKLTFDDLAAIVRNDYIANKRKSIVHLELHLSHLRQHFEALRAVDITTDRITEFIAKMQVEGYAAGTINLHLATLQRAFSLMVNAKLLSHDQRPHFPYLAVHNARSGFFERPEFEAILAHLRDELRAPLEASYITGWRFRSELLTRRWLHVDLAAGWLRLDPGETKNREGRAFPLLPPLRALLEAQREHTSAVERELGQIIPWVFHRNGQRIRCIQKAWETARRKAGYPTRLIHDCRRTAVRNLERAGISRSAAMRMVGHKTEAIYRRYAIVSEADLREAGDKLATLLENEPKAPAKVSPIRKGHKRGTARG